MQAYNKIIRKVAVPCKYDTHPNCPKCGSEDTELKEISQTDYLHRPMQYPLCKTCGYNGMMAFESISWSGALVNNIFCQTKEQAIKAIELCQNKK